MCKPITAFSFSCLLLIFLQGCLSLPSENESNAEHALVSKTIGTSATYEELLISNKKFQEEAEQLAQESEQQKKLIAQLQLALLKKHAEISSLSKKNDTLVNDFVRNTKHIQKSGTHVETVRMLAETAAIIDNVKAFDKTQKWSQSIKKAEQYLLDGQAELNSGNIEGASYLANQAIEIIESCDLDPNGEKKASLNGEIEFFPYLLMKTLKNTNVRAKPSLQSDVLFTVNTGTPVTAVGYLNEWVKITLKDGKHGWVYHSLLRGAF